MLPSSIVKPCPRLLIANGASREPKDLLVVGPEAQQKKHRKVARRDVAGHPLDDAERASTVRFKRGGRPPGRSRHLDRPFTPPKPTVVICAALREHR